MHEIEEIINSIKDSGLYPDVPIVDGPATEPEMIIDGTKYLVFSSNNYLGMSSHPEVKKAMQAAVERYGLGSGGPRLLTGNIDIHNELECTVADYFKQEAAICFNAGYMANIGLIPALSNLIEVDLKSSVMTFAQDKILNGIETSIFSDRKNHGSIVDGVRLAKVEKFIYKHCDMSDLEVALKKATGRRKIIITDGVFSMDGDIAPLDHIVELAKQFEASLIVDDAHGIGVLGETGRGSFEHFNIDQNDEIVRMGTFTKAFGGVGGFVVGKRWLIDYLRITARTYLLSAPLPPVIAAGLKRSVELVAVADDRRETAWHNAEYFRNAVKGMGYNTVGSNTLIVPVIFGTDQAAMQATKILFKKGIIAPNVRYPAVEHGNSRIRFVMTSSYTKEQIDTLLNALLDTKKELKL
ncbi:MAG: pyridoxal phosphate-dependent aminotransferase family protein [bacterium]